MFAFITQGVSLGFAAGAMPGPFTGYLVSLTLAYGWRRSLIVVLSPLLTDGPIILAVVLLLRQMPEGFIQAVQVAGGLYLLWIAWGAWQRFRAGSALAGGGPPPARTLAQGLIMNWLSPGPYLFWTTVNGPLLVRALSESAWHGLAFLAAFYGTFLGFLALYVVVFDRLRRLDDRVTRGLLLLTIGVMAAFGLALIRQGVGALLAAA